MFREDIFHEILHSIDPKIEDTERALKDDPNNEHFQERLGELAMQREILGNEIEGYAEPLK